MSELTAEYQLLCKQLSALLDGENDPITNMSQFSALIFNSLQGVNWAGFYLAYSDSALQLGPFQGQVACTKIPMGKGVCGTAAKSGKSQLVADVHQFPGHIACDSRSQSEIVCPINQDGHLIGVFDIDSPHLERFSSEDVKGIENLILILNDATDFSGLISGSNPITD